MNIENNKKSNKIDIETKEIVKDFISEAYQLLDKATPAVTNLDSKNNTEAINVIFRLFHSLKGSAGFLNFTNIGKLTHEAETLLGLFRNKRMIPTKKEISLLYETSDVLEELIHQVADNYNDKGYEKEVKQIVDKISNCISKCLSKKIEKDKNKSAMEIFKEENLDIEKYGFMGTFVENIDKKDLQTQIINEYIKQANRIIESSLMLFDEIKEKSERKDTIIDLLKFNYSLKRNSEAIGYYEIKEFCEKIEKLLLKIYSEYVLINEKIKSLLKNSYTLIKQSINTINCEIDKIKPDFINEKSEIINSINLIIENGSKKRSVKPLGEILVEMGALDGETVEQALELQKITSEEKRLDIESKMFTFRKEDIIRVDRIKMDELFDLIGELTVTEIMVTRNPDLEGLNLENFDKASTSLTKITHELQSAILSIRMVPLDSLFNKMFRLVNQLSKNANKDVNFSISGSSTEVDRKLIEKIYNPLVHIIRNAVDHGIENEEERRKNNKSKIGNIKLSAKHEGNELWISVIDDGQGLDRNEIIKVAKKMNLEDGKQLETLSDEEIWKIIYEPGFSTSKTISNVSGRGVGMDVVKKNIEKLRGQVDIISNKGESTEVIMKIPLTLEIMKVMILSIDGSNYSIPVSDIIETLSIDRNVILEVEENKYAIKFREEIIPLLRLHEIFSIKTNKKSFTEGIITIITKHNKKISLFVDKIIGTQQIVIKPMPNYFGRLNIVSGCSILGNGDISLIIDTGNLIKACID